MEIESVSTVVLMEISSEIEEKEFKMKRRIEFKKMQMLLLQVVNMILEMF